MSAPPAASTGAANAPSKVLPPLLACVAGYVDTIGFVLLGGVFLAHVTGNFVVAGADIAQTSSSPLGLKLLVLPVFIVGVALGWMLQRRFRERAPFAIALTETAALAACSIALIIASRPSPAIPHADLLALAMGVIAMGLQAVLGRVARLPMTTVMTGNVTQLTSDALDALVGARGARGSLWPGAVLVLSFALGAIAAGIGVHRLGALASTLPPALMTVATAAIFRASRSVSTTNHRPANT